MANKRSGRREQQISTPLELILNFTSSLSGRLTSQLNDTSVSTLSSEIQSHINTLRSSGVNLLTKDTVDQAKELDGRAIAIWNLTTRIGGEADGSVEPNARHNHDKSTSTKAQLLALLRMFCFHLLDCTARSHKHLLSSARRSVAEQWKDTVRLLRTAVKAAKSAVQCGLLDYGGKVVERAADYEEELGKLCRRLSTPANPEEDAEKQTLHQSLRLKYLQLRILLAWKQDSLELAETMFNHAVDPARPLPTSTAEDLADLTFEIGKGLLKKVDHYRASKWLERAHGVLQRVESEALSPDAEELRLSVAHHLVRVYIGLDTDAGREKAQHLLQWMDGTFLGKMVLSILKLDLLSTTDPFDAQGFFDALSNIIRTMHLTSSNFKMVLSYVRKLKDHHTQSACSALDDLIILRLLEDDKDEYIQKAFMTRVWITTESTVESDNNTTPNITSTCETLKQLMDSMHSRLHFPLSAKATHAAQTLLWKRIDASFKSEDSDMAHVWSNLTIHPLLSSSSGEGNAAKLARKVITCAIARQDLEAAKATFNQMPEGVRDEPLTRYLAYKIALRDGDEALAAECFGLVARQTLKADPTLLYACVLEAQQSGNRMQAIKALQALLGKCSQGELQGVHLPSVFRCTLKLLVAELPATDSAKSDARSAVCQLFEKAIHAFTQQSATFDVKECQWFHTNSYNLALKHYTEWPGPEILMLLKCSAGFQPRNMGKATEKQQYMVNCSLQALIYLKLARADTDEQDQRGDYMVAWKYCNSYYDTYGSLQVLHALDQLSFAPISRRVLTTGFEAAIRLEKWKDCLKMIDRCARFDLKDAKFYQLLADMILPSKAPAEVIIRTLQRIIAIASSIGQSLPRTTQARWYRILYTLSLKQDPGDQIFNSDSTTTTATNWETNEDTSTDTILTSVLTLLRSSQHERNANTDGNPERYPPEELEFLAISTYNRAVDAYIANASRNSGNSANVSTNSTNNAASTKTAGIDTSANDANDINDAETKRLGNLAVELAGFMDDDGALGRMIRGRVGEMVGPLVD